MELIQVEIRTEDLLDELLEIWENSVRETHLFLAEEDIIKIRNYVPDALKQIKYLVIARNSIMKPVAFMGIEDNKLEMLFIHPDDSGKGLGKRLLVNAFEQYDVNEVCVNEQNPEAVGFYEHMGFKVYKRTELDEQSNAFPMLYMKK